MSCTASIPRPPFSMLSSASKLSTVWACALVCTPISYLVGRERIFDDVTANNSNEYVTIKVDRHVVLAYT
jgi:hypothetical protein